VRGARRGQGAGKLFRGQEKYSGVVNFKYQISSVKGAQFDNG
jgi:hypothetical protein